MTEQLLGHRAGRDVGGSLASAGAFEHVAGVGEAVLLHPGQIGVPGPDLGERRLGLPRRRRHLPMPLVAPEPLGVLDLDRDRRAERASVSHAADQCQLVGLEALARTAPVPEPAASHLDLDLLDGDLEPGRESLDDDHQGLPMRLAGGEETEHPGEIIRGA